MDNRAKLKAKSRATAALNVSYAGIMVWLRAALTAVTAFVRLWD